MNMGRATAARHKLTVTTIISSKRLNPDWRFHIMATATHILKLAVTTVYARWLQVEGVQAVCHTSLMNYLRYVLNFQLITRWF